MSHPKPVVLCILDGWGLSDRTEDNAPHLAETPTYDRIMATCPHATLITHGPDVGLPRGQMGNSEVGHTNIGAGRVVAMDLGQIDLAIEDGSFAKNDALLEFARTLKSTGGIFIVDDLGRQAESPQALVNRWIVPLEENKDILALQSGEKFEVPFDTLVIFSTNFHPNEIFDQAALRRIFFKIKIDGPDQENFLKIFAMVARKKGMPLDEAALVHLLKSKYPTINNVYANYQPVFLIDQMISICEFEGIPYQMSPELIDRAWANMFVKDEVIVK